MSNKQIESSIKAERVRRGLTQVQVAEKLHMSKNAYSLKENGIRKFNLNEFRTLLEIFQCEPQELL